MNVQIIEHNGEPEYAVIDFKEYEAMREALENAEDLADAISFKSNGSETFPATLVERLCDGSNPIMEYRKYRKLTQAALAEKVEVSQAAIAGIESGKKDPSISLLKKLATTLAVDIDDLVS